MIGVVADMLKLHPQTLRMYERKGLIRPNRTEGKTRLYSADDVEDVARLVRLTRDLGVNLAGVEIILRMRSRMQEMQRQIEALVEHVRAEPARPSGEPHSEGEALVRAASTQLSPIDLF
jgi:MerR family transcriptional regulator/heat shock protein HspR